MALVGTCLLLSWGCSGPGQTRAPIVVGDVDAGQMSGDANEQTDAGSGYVELDTNCQAEAVLKFDDEPVQTTYQFSIDPP